MDRKDASKGASARSRAPTSSLRFDAFKLDLETGELWQDGDTVDLPPQPTKVLLLLARNRGRLVTRDQIREAVWSDTVLEFDQAINAAVRQVRAALGDDARQPRYVETVPRRGYRFIAPVEEEVADGKPDAPAPSWAGQRLRWVAGGAMLLMLVIVIGAVLMTTGGAEEAVMIAVVPARAQVAGSDAEVFGEALTQDLLDALGHLEPHGIQVMPWTWDMSYDKEDGAVYRDGRPLGVDFAVDTNVYMQDGLQVSVSLLKLNDGRQVWYRRFDHPASDPEGARARIATEVTAVVANNLAGQEGGSS